MATKVITLTVALALTATGAIDEDGSRAAFNAALSKHQAETETETTEIAAVVSDLFDENMGQYIALPTVANMAAVRMNAQPANHQVLADRVANYLRANSQGKKQEDGTFERATSEFVISKGPKGGVARRADLPVPAPKTDSK